MKKYFISYLLFLFISLFSLEIFFKVICFNSFFDFELLRIGLFTLTTSFIASAIITIFKGKIAKVLTLIFVLFYGLYTFVELSFKHFLGNFMSISMLFGGGDANRISAEANTFISSINPLYYLCFIPFIVLLIIFIFKKFDYEKLTLMKSLEKLIIIAVLILISLLSLYISPSDQIKPNKELYKAPNLLDVSLKEFGVGRFLERDVVFFLSGSSSTSIIDVSNNEETVITDYSRIIDDTKWKEIMNNETDGTIKNLHQYYMSQTITPKNEYTGIFKDKNLILIQVESLDLAAINETLTPTLYRLAHEGWYFNNYYAPKYSCATGESEFMALTSIIPSNTTCVPYTYLNNNYNKSIFNLFKTSDYMATSYHSVSDKYYPRKTLHANLGSSYYYNSSDLDVAIANGWPSDLKLMQEAYKVFGESDKYFSYMITASMHFTYDFDSTVVNTNWSQVKDLPYATTMKRYLAKCIEFDKSLKYLIDSLTTSGTLDDTVIVIYSDHHPYNLTFSYLEELSNVDRSGLDEDLSPLIIYNSEVEAQTVSKVSSTIDILPTLANLFDLSYDPRLYMGTDIFSAGDGLTIFPTGSWVTEEAYYHVSTGKWEARTGYEDIVNSEYIAKMNKIVNNKITASDNSLKKDYFKTLDTSE